MLELTKGQTTEGFVDLTLRVPVEDSERVERALKLLLAGMPSEEFSEGRSYTPDQVFGPREPGRIIRGARTREGWAQGDLAKKLGVARTVVCDMEKGRRPVSRKMAEKLGEVFETSYKLFL